MSLIERAIDRLGGGSNPTPELPKPLPDVAAQSSNSIKLNETVVTAKSVAQTASPPIVSTSSIGTEPVRVAAKFAEANRREPVRLHLESMRLKGLLTPDAKQSTTGEEFRVIKRPLLANAFGKGTAPVRNGKRIMVTSAFPGEGKSFCAINLAMSIAAERDQKVLLVDADVARPSIPRELGISAEAGLMDWLIDGKLDVADLVLATNVDKLSILPAGRRHQSATELLASTSMSRLLEQISSRYPDRICIFDSPPLLVTTEARVLASYMGQIVMVVEAGRTPRDIVMEALSTIESNEVIGLVLNKAKKIETSGYYGYGYGAA
jgi:protein-tyrosine kinase